MLINGEARIYNTHIYYSISIMLMIEHFNTGATFLHIDFHMNMAQFLFYCHSKVLPHLCLNCVMCVPQWNRFQINSFLNSTIQTNNQSKFTPHEKVTMFSVMYSSVTSLNFRTSLVWSCEECCSHIQCICIICVYFYKNM